MSKKEFFYDKNVGEKFMGDWSNSDVKKRFEHLILGFD